MKLIEKLDEFINKLHRYNVRPTTVYLTKRFFEKLIDQWLSSASVIATEQFYNFGTHGVYYNGIKLEIKQTGLDFDKCITCDGFGHSHIKGICKCDSSFSDCWHCKGTGVR